MASNERWRVWGRVAGPELPQANTQVGDITLGPAAGIAKPPDHPVKMNTPRTEGHASYSQAASLLEVSSPCFLWVDDIAAESSDAAIEKVATEHAPMLAAALSGGHAGPSYRIQVFGAQNRMNGYSFAALMQFAFWDDSPITSERLFDVALDYETIQGNPHARKAATLLARGTALADAGSDVSTVTASLLAFYQVLETLAMAIPPTTAADYADQQAQIVAKLSKTLQAKDKVSKRVAAVRDATVALDRLDAKYASLRIANAADALGLTTEWTNRATELGKLRNTKLGHSGASVELRALKPWLDDNDSNKISAPRLAKSMLEAFVAHLRGV